MNVSLTPYFEEFVQNLVGSGQYHSASEVIRDALRLLKEREDNSAERKKVLKALIRAGVESGEAQAFNVEGFLQEVNKRHSLKNGNYNGE